MPAFNFNEEVISQALQGVDISAYGLARAHAGICKSMKAPASFDTNDVHQLKVKQFIYYNENG